MRQTVMSRRKGLMALPGPQRDGIVVRARSGQRQSQEFRLHFLGEAEVLCAVEVRAAVELAVDKYFEFVFASRDVADVNTLHAALPQGLEFFEAVDVVCNELAV